MKLIELLEPIRSIELNLDITGLQVDSRCINAGDLFCAYKGEKVDGRDFIEQAEQAGAKAVIYDPSEFVLPKGVSIPCVSIPALRDKLGLIASRFYGDPTHDLCVTGVTGTNGKTTIAYQLAQAYVLFKQKSLYLGTLGIGSHDKLVNSNNTTPDAFTLQKAFFDAKRSGVEHVCMEVSSHALHQGRVNGVRFKQAIFTNLTHDHLDYHHTIAAYAEAKAQLFATFGLQWAIINGDDAFNTLMQANLPHGCQRLTYGIHADHLDVRAVEIDTGMSGSFFKLISPFGDFRVQTRSIGQFNIYNSLAVAASLLASGIKPADVADIMPQLLASPGRMEIVSQSPGVIVDYAHTPDALENALTTLVALKRGQLLVVFGCGGDRDKTKRSLMGEIACRYADKVILTSDNPRTEEPEAIIKDIKAGIVEYNKVDICLDRTLAIHHALKQAKPADLILIAGKGHENYQEIGHEKRYFSDQEVVLNYTTISLERS